MSFYYIVTFTKASGGNITNVYSYNNPNIVPLTGDELRNFSKHIIAIEQPVIAALNESLTSCFNQEYGYTSYIDLTRYKI